MGMAVGIIPGIEFPGFKKGDVRQKFEFVCRGTLGFLNTFVKKERDKRWALIVGKGSKYKSFIEVKELMKKDK
jgi:hypothetical protein